MSDERAREILRGVLSEYTAGSLLHLVGELIEEDAHAARRDGDDGRCEQLMHAACTLFVVGLGLHVVFPR